jgi:phospholipid transport system substrate-binding protein
MLANFSRKTLLGIALLLTLPTSGLPETTPKEVVKDTVNRAIEVLKDPALQSGDAKRNEKRRRLQELLSDRFDFGEMAKRSLGKHWGREPSKQEKFVSAFTAFVQDAYLAQIEGYSSETVSYHGEVVEGRLAEVETKMNSNKRPPIPIHYKFHKTAKGWRVYDVMIESVSLVNNYRSQFQRVLDTGSLDDLIRRLEEKRQAKTTQAFPSR